MPLSRAAGPAPDNATARYEVRFLEGMIDHHAMAVHMGEMCLQKSIHPELKTLCQNIVSSQAQQIQQMQSWLQSWYGISFQPQMTTGEMQQMQRLASMSGAEFEIEFMERMIRHHWKAVVEGSQCIDRAHHQELVNLCENIVLTQTAEIQQMRTWLCQWYGVCNYGPKGNGPDRG
jgi:uncharacterized protein (DUF305 family)